MGVIPILAAGLLAVYFLLFLINTLQSLKNFPLLQRYARRLRTFRHLEALDQSTLTPLTLILPVSRLSTQNVIQWLKVEYPEVEFILVHDQVTPQVMLAWRDRLHLKPTARFPVGDLNTAAVQGIFQGEKDSRIWFIDKAPSHLSDALNTGLNFCQTPLVAMVSAEIYPEGSIFKQSARVFLEDKQVWAVSGRIRSQDKPEQATGQSPVLPASAWGCFEVIYEQFQHLLQWNRYSHKQNFYELSPLYTVFRRSKLLESGGFTGQYQSFMVDIVRNLRDLSERSQQPFTFAFLPDTLGWKVAARQRSEMRDFFRYHQQVGKRLTSISLSPRATLGRLRHHIAFPLFFFAVIGAVIALSFSAGPEYLLLLPLVISLPLLWAIMALRAGEFTTRRYRREDLSLLFITVWKTLWFWPVWCMAQMVIGWFARPQPLRETSRDPILNPSPLKYTAPLDPEALDAYENP